MALVDHENREELVAEKKRNSLAGLQTGGRLSPCPLSIREFGYKSFIGLSEADRRRVIKRQYEALFGSPGKNSE